MRRCEECSSAGLLEVEGEWIACPLCGAALDGDTEPSQLPDVPLAFSRQRVFKVLFFSSLAIILASFLAQLLFFSREPGIGALRSIWLGVASMWLVTVMAIRKRHNVAKGTVYLVVISGLVCVFWDYLTGWHDWSVTYAVPLTCAASIVALLITMRVTRTDVGDHILYTGLTVLLGFVPIVFLVFGWVSHPLPSAICIALSLVALGLLYANSGQEMRHELAKRLNL